jgi:hypothetical protein
MSSVIVVDPDRLPETPPAFQQYVYEFFLKRKVLGRDCWVASTVLSPLWPLARGTAPSHSVDLMRFKEGLKENQTLNEWMDKAEDKFFWRFYGRDEHRDCGACDDD